MKEMRFAPIFVVFCMLLLSAGVFAGQATIYSSTGSWMDAYIDSANLTTNYGSNAFLLVDGDHDYGYQYHSLIWFDVSSAGIPAGSTIDDANLNVYIYDESSDNYNVYQLTEDWNDMEATWNERKTGVNWSAPGAGTLSHDPTILDTLNFGTPSKWEAINLTQAIQDWVDDPNSNYGIVIYNDSSTGGLDLYSSESGNPPYVTIDFTLPPLPSIPVKINDFFVSPISTKGNGIIDVNIEVENTSGAPVNVSVELTSSDSRLDYSFPSYSIDPAIEKTHVFTHRHDLSTFSPPIDKGGHFISTTVSITGNPSEFISTRTVFTVLDEQRPLAVPETDLFLLPIIALVVALALSRR